jgi:hypothetical protein
MKRMSVVAAAGAVCLTLSAGVGTIVVNTGLLGTASSSGPVGRLSPTSRPETYPTTTATLAVPSPIVTFSVDPLAALDIHQPAAPTPLPAPTPSRPKTATTPTPSATAAQVASAPAATRDGQGTSQPVASPSPVPSQPRPTPSPTPAQTAGPGDDDHPSWSASPSTTPRRDD